MKKFLKSLTQNLTLVLLFIGIIIALNILSYHHSFRFDITEEKEYTLSEATIDLLHQLQDRLTLKVYFSEDLPAQLKPIEEDVLDTFQELKAHAKKPVRIEFEKPDINEEAEKQTVAVGITPLQVNIREKDKLELKKIYMGLALYYQDKKQVIPVVAQVANLEYALALSLAKLTQKELPKVGLLLPQGEKSQRYRLIKEITKELASPVDLTPESKDFSKQKLKSLLIVEPEEISEDFKNQMDDALMNGINIMLFASQVDISNSLSPVSISTGLTDWLGKKGVKISEKLLLDPTQNAEAGFNTGYLQVYVPYPFWLKVFHKNMNGTHPVTSQLEEALMPWTNVIFASEEESDWQTTTLIESSKNSFLQEDDNPSVSPQYMEEMTAMPELSSYKLSVVLENSKDKNSGRIFLTSNARMLEDNFLQQSPSNALFYQNLLEYTSWGKQLIGVRSKGKTARPLEDISEPVKNVMKWGHMIGIPVLTIFIGLLYLWLAKKRREQFLSEIVGG